MQRLLLPIHLLAHEVRGPACPTWKSDVQATLSGDLSVSSPSYVSFVLSHLLNLYHHAALMMTFSSSLMSARRLIRFRRLSTCSSASMNDASCPFCASCETSRPLMSRSPEVFWVKEARLRLLKHLVVLGVCSIITSVLIAEVLVAGYPLRHEICTTSSRSISISIVLPPVSLLILRTFILLFQCSFRCQASKLLRAIAVVS